MLASSINYVGGSVYLLGVRVLLGGVHDGGGALGCLVIRGGAELGGSTALGQAASLAAA